ncbi:Cannabidiolic acid synthase [Linum perenne]
MATLSNLIILLISFLSSSQFVSSATAAPLQDFLQCLHSHTADHSDLIYTQKSESFSSILQSSIRNQRFNYTQNSSRKQPLAIITPHTVSQIQSTVLCSQNHTALQLRVRSGGHDFEGLSYVSSQPFLLIDLKSAWVQAGAVLGEVYHAIASATPNLAFPAGICPTVGIGGHISGDQKLKAKSDYVEIPLPLTALQGLLNSVYEIEMGPSTFIQVIPHGGRMSQISDSSIPYPRRAGTMYKIQYYVGWSGEEKGVEKMHLGWIRRLYEFMRPYVSENPRGAYVNSRDLDLGKNNPGNYTSYKQAKVWGQKYYKHNFERLARVKAAIDPTNFFRNEQSVPPYA